MGTGASSGVALAISSASEACAHIERHRRIHTTKWVVQVVQLEDDAEIDRVHLRSQAACGPSPFEASNVAEDLFAVLWLQLRSRSPRCTRLRGWVASVGWACVVSKSMEDADETEVAREHARGHVPYGQSWEVQFSRSLHVMHCYRGSASWELVRLRKALAALDECDSKLWGCGREEAFRPEQE
eukprot:2975294-Amphidinium_carterae.1